MKSFRVSSFFFISKVNNSTNCIQISLQIGWAGDPNVQQDGRWIFEIFGRIGWPASNMYNTILPCPIHPTLPCPSLGNALSAGHWRGKTEQMHIFLKITLYKYSANYCSIYVKHSNLSKYLKLAMIFFFKVLWRYCSWCASTTALLSIRDSFTETCVTRSFETKCVKQIQPKHVFK